MFEKPRVRETADRTRRWTNSLRECNGFLFHLAVGLLVHTRYSHENVGPNLEKGLGHLLEERALGQGDAVEEQGNIRVARGHAREREKGNTNLPRVNVKTVKGMADIRGQITVAPLYALGLASCSRGVNDGCQSPALIRNGIVSLDAT
jgi:hypothetical protein